MGDTTSMLYRVCREKGAPSEVSMSLKHNKYDPSKTPQTGNIGKYREKKNEENQIVALYGSWEALDGCKILPRDVGIISTLADTFPEKNVCCYISSYFLENWVLQKSSVFLYG